MGKDQDPRRSESIRSLKKGLDVLHRFLAQDEWGVRELSQAIGLPRSTTGRILQTLEEEGILEGDPGSGKYRLGFELYRIASIVVTKMDVIRIALPLMKQLAAECNETVYLLVYHGCQLTFISKVDCPHPVKYVVELGRSQSAHCGASGKAIMAYLSTDELEFVIRETGLAPVTPNTITDRARLLADLDLTRTRGFAFSVGERIPGVVGIAAPVFDARGQVFGGLNVTIPDSRFQPGMEAHLGPLVSRYAKCLSDMLGHVPNHKKAEGG